MKNLETLIQKLCPDGVEFVKLVKYVNVQYGFAFDSKLFTDDEQYIPLIRIRDVVPAKPSTYYSGEYCSDYIIRKGDMLVGMDGNFNMEKWNDRDGLLNQRVCKIYAKDESLLLDGFLYHYLRPLFKKIENSIQGSTVKHLSAKVINHIEIPLPPIEVQTEIVRILDKFTSLEAELEMELEAELDCRKRQYEYYRDKLLSFDNVGGQEVEWKKMSEVGTFIRGKRFVRTDIVEEGVPCIHYGDIYTYYGLTATKAKTYLKPEKAEKMKFASKNDVVIVGAGENNMDIGVGVAWLSDEKVAIHDACYIFKSKMNSRFVSHYLRGSNYHLQIKKYVCEGKICSISSKSIGRSLIPVPSLQEQERIATILDRFESLTTSLQSGLPAEITARRQQYEHYRDKLLTFKRKGAA